ncbi:dihydrolipoamide acetyltransferase family protein [Streptomyces sp. ADMS]|uniref:dihydrolipoamide acetyltransferase family protein n=1 Tax=Streptomyces sp. ADMS TaxID=3071415 RepID=UPI00296F086F|nr:dihydrolipoamide acetyltransferase family protein [Streptomyces sp. ADMS]MDW4904196.1 dihydrolipoamide acetyltransferase family protein [Streptomyces sp. ADMS]
MTDVAVEVLLPKIGLTMQEGTIDEWLVPTGSAVAEGDALLRLATDKVDVDVEAEAGGLFHPVVPAGATVPAGALIGWLLAEGEQPPDPGGTPMPAGSGSSSGTAALPSLGGGAGAGAVLVPTGGGAGAGALTAGTGTGTAPGADGAGAARSANGAGGRLLSSPNARRVAVAADVDLTAVRGTGPGGRIVSEDVEEFLAALPGDLVTPVPPGDTSSSPLVRKLAKERGIDLSGVSGTGPGGRIRRSDLDALTPAPVRRSAVPQPGDVLPLTGMRGTIARRMHASLQEMAQLTHGYEVRMDAVVSLRDRLKEEWADSELPVPSLNDFLLKAAALALREHPLLNATVREDGIHLLDGVHLGFAVAVPGGLMVPVIEDAVALPLPEIARRSKALAQAAREGRISPAQLEGATFTVTSLGGYGVDFFTPVVNPGNVGILGVGRLRDGVEWVDDRPVRTRVLTLSLTFDHRAVDGAPAAEYLRTVGELLSKPLRLLV